ncbi:MAG TPA: prepilin-type N-terminal cleavage/methylation domain-containing protein [Oculatellaceae cyanobacterium]
MKFFHNKKALAFSLIELIVSIFVIALLAVLVTMAYERLSGMAGRAKCTSNLRKLHSAFEAHLQDVGYWPPQPEFAHDDREGYETWWIERMKPYDVNPDDWLCPTIKKEAAAAKPEDRLRMHYIPTRFDAQRRTPHRWPKMPWIIEIGNAHGRGPLMLMHDGAVVEMSDIVPDFYTD